MLGLELRLPRVWPKIRPLPYVLNNTEAVPQSVLMFIFWTESNSSDFDTKSELFPDDFEDEQVATDVEGDKLTEWRSFLVLGLRKGSNWAEIRSGGACQIRSNFEPPRFINHGWCRLRLLMGTRTFLHANNLLEAA